MLNYSFFKSPKWLILFGIMFASSCSSEPNRDTELSKSAVPNCSVNSPVGKPCDDLSHREWLTLVGVTSRCSAKSESNGIRYVNRISLRDEGELIMLACELGAYQDSYLGFWLSDKGVKAVEFLQPHFKDKWQFVSKSLLLGNPQSDKPGSLMVTTLSSGSGYCGHQVKYDLSTISSGELTVLSAWGDEDCYNGIGVGDWPPISLEY